MSTEARLARLGLLHLKDEPEGRARALTEARRTPGARIGGGLYADVYETGDRDCVVKIARTRQEVAEAKPSHEAALAFAFATGSHFAIEDVDPNEVLACEARQLIDMQGAFGVVLEQGERDGRRYHVLARVEGTTLATPIRRGALDPDVLMRVCTALEGGLHGDLKPDNIMLDAEGQLRIIDPSAYYLRLAGPVTTRILTTPLYNPGLVPSDVPSLGLLLIEVCLGAPLLLMAGARRPSPRSPALDRVIELSAACGRPTEWLTRFVVPSALDGPVGIHPELERIALQALGLSWDGDKLDVAQPHPHTRAFLEDLAVVISRLRRDVSFVSEEGHVVRALHDGESFELGAAKVCLGSRGCEVENLGDDGDVFVDGRVERGARVVVVDGATLHIGERVLTAHSPPHTQ